MDERNVCTIREKEGLARAKNLTPMLPEDREFPYHRSD